MSFVTIKQGYKRSGVKNYGGTRHENDQPTRLV